MPLKLLHVALKLDNPGWSVSITATCTALKSALDNTYQLLDKIPVGNRIVITESGIHSREDVAAMRQQKVNAFLVGEAFMRSEEPGDTAERSYSVSECQTPPWFSRYRNQLTLFQIF